MTWHVEHVTRTIRATPEAVALVAGDPAQLPRWAAGLSSGIRREGEHWITDSPMGAVEVRFTGPVEAGILDHDVILPDGTTVRNPFRVLSNDDGSEVVFSVFQRDGMSDDEFAADVRAVGDDLARLAGLVES
ncbi:SRPBCC family protein [Frondihabitans sucicola]|nr:SRPBCC family protein [Frondihabitans sucicola]